MSEDTHVRYLAIVLYHTCLFASGTYTTSSDPIKRFDFPYRLLLKRGVKLPILYGVMLLSYDVQENKNVSIAS